MSYNDNNGYNNYGQDNYGQYSQGAYGQPTYGQGGYRDPAYGQSNQNYYGANDPMYNQGNYSMGGYDAYSRQANVNQYNSQYNSASSYGGEISFQAYNLIIGAILLYGFIVNAVMVGLFTDQIIDFVLMQPILFYVSYFVMAIVGTLMIRKSDNPAISFIGYNFIVIPLGMVIAASIECYVMAGYSSVVSTAFLITGGVTVAMMFLSSIFPNFFLRLGRTLCITLLITVVIECVSLFAGAALGIIDYVVVVVFCGYIGYDWAKANTEYRTVDSAIDSASELYLDIANLFLRIMRILARSSNN